MHVMTGGSVFRAARLWTRRRHFGLARGLPKSSAQVSTLQLLRLSSLPFMPVSGNHRKRPIEYIAEPDCLCLFAPVYWTTLDKTMARRIRESILDSRDARAKLKVRGKPYWRSIGSGLHVGYRK